MAISDHHHPADPALDQHGPKPTDSDLPLSRRTHATPYIVAIALVLAIGAALVIFGVARLGESTETIRNSGDALAPTEGLVPEQPSEPAATESGGQLFDPDIVPSERPEPREMESPPDAGDVPGGN